jgi:hypothetical protein
MKGAIMKLSDFLAALKSPNVQVVVTDLQDTEICKIFASSYTALDESVSERTVNRWTIKSATNIEIVLNDA